MSADAARLALWAEALVPVAEAAGRLILDMREGTLAVDAKADASPVTAADRAAEALILAAIDRLEPRLPVVAEEKAAAEGLPSFPGEDFWLVDALDGTREFLRRGRDFTVNVAVVQAGTPVLGIVHVPARAETFVGIVPLRRAERRAGGAVTPIAVRRRPARVVVTGSKSHEVQAEMAKFLAAHDVAAHLKVGSSLKFCLVAAGEVDLYPRFGPTNEWDTAAGDAIVRAAGGTVATFDGVPLRYRKPGFLNGPFLAGGAP